MPYPQTWKIGFRVERDGQLETLFDGGVLVAVSEYNHVRGALSRLLNAVLEPTIGGAATRERNDAIALARAILTER